MATTAFVLLALATLVALGRPAGPLALGALPGAALRGALVLSRLSDRRRQRLCPAPSDADHEVVAHRARSADPVSGAARP